MTEFASGFYHRICVCVCAGLWEKEDLCLCGLTESLFFFFFWFAGFGPFLGARCVGRRCESEDRWTRCRFLPQRVQLSQKPLDPNRNLKSESFDRPLGGEALKDVNVLARHFSSDAVICVEISRFSHSSNHLQERAKVTLFSYTDIRESWVC